MGTQAVMWFGGSVPLVLTSWTAGELLTTAIAEDD